MLTIKKAAALTGVSAHTLRAWERRYALFAPTRTEAGYRVYDQDALVRINRMRTLVDAGVPPRRAAARLAALDPREPVTPIDTDLLSAAAAIDARRVQRLISARVADPDFELMVDSWLMPTLEDLGKVWADGEVSVAGEHLVANITQRCLSARYDVEEANVGGGPLLLGTAPGVDHTLGLLAFAVAARRAGIATVYLGAHVPPAEWRLAAQRCAVVAAVTVVPCRRDAVRASAVADCLAEVDVPLWVGGRFQHLVGSEDRRLGHQIGPAARRLAESIAA